MDVLDDQWSQWPVPPETPDDTDFLFAFDRELGPEWQRAIVGCLNQLWR